MRESIIGAKEFLLRRYRERKNSTQVPVANIQALQVRTPNEVRS